MNILTNWLRNAVPDIAVDDRQLAEDLTLRGIAVEGVRDLGPSDTPNGSHNGHHYEMDITTNRVDAMNHHGIAREAATIYDLPLMPFHLDLPTPQPGDGFRVRIEATDLCGRFTARVIRGVSIAPSKGEIADGFALLGQKAISNAVDATNYVLLLMGQPTHTFDLDKIEGGIVVRRALAGETLRLLDGSEKMLVAEDLVVADEKKALALAGVMGGWDSRVTEETRNILVEAAWFDPAAIRASSRRHGLHTDASHRFERGADFNAAPIANALVTQIILQTGGAIVGPLVDVVVPEMAAKTAARPAVALKISEVQRMLGTTLDGNGIPAETVVRYLTALGCKLAATGAGEYAVTLPSWRLDLEREIDLIEEVARVYGYNRFANTLPVFTGAVRELPHGAQEHALRETLRGLGYSETISSTFVSAAEDAGFAHGEAVAMGNPLNAEAGFLRPSLLPGMATMLAHNLHRDIDAVRLFELGTVFTGSSAEVAEAVSLALGATGAATATTLSRADDALFYTIKGVLEALLVRFSGSVTFDAIELPGWIAPGRGARALLAGKPVAVFGELNSAETQRRKLRQACVLATVDAQALLTSPLRTPVARELSRFQSVERDFSFIFPDAVRWAAIDDSVRALAQPELISVEPMDVFRDMKGKAVPNGQYSLLLRVVFQSVDRTLTEQELTEWSGRIAAALTTLGGTQRA